MRGNRLLRRASIALLVLIGVLVAADRLGVMVAQKAAATTLQRSEHLDRRPSVAIAGFPFLTQLVAGSLDRVNVRADDVTVGENGYRLRIASIDAVMHVVSVSSDLSTVHAQSATATGLVSYVDLSRLLGVDVRYAGSGSGAGRVAATKSVELAGQTISATVSADLSVADNVLAFTDPTVSGTASALPSEVLAGLQSPFAIRVPLTHLPLGLTVRDMTAGPQGVAVTLSGRNLSFRR